MCCGHAHWVPRIPAWFRSWMGHTIFTFYFFHFYSTSRPPHYVSQSWFPNSVTLLLHTPIPAILLHCLGQVPDIFISIESHDWGESIGEESEENRLVLTELWPKAALMEVFISFSLLLRHFSTFYIHSFSGCYALPASLCPFWFYIVNYSRSKGILNRPLRGQKNIIIPFFPNFQVFEHV